VKCVDAIIHVASPLANAASPQVILDTAISGTARIVDVAHAAGVKQLVITASIGSLATPDDFWKEMTISEKTYSPLTIEEALLPGTTPIAVYFTSKALADLAVRDYKRAHPELDLTTIHPSYVYGPLGRGQVYSALTTGTNRYIYALIDGEPGRPISGYDTAKRAAPLSVDVRDVARAHVFALKVPPSDQPKRFVVSSSRFTWIDAVEFLAQARPELKERLPVITGNESPVQPFATLDTSTTESVLGLKDYIKWQDTILDTVDDMLRIEKELAAAAQ